MSARAVVAGIDGRAAPFPIYVTAGDALPFVLEFLLMMRQPTIAGWFNHTPAGKLHLNAARGLS